jgi:molecular chaperone DnaJ
VLRDPEKRSAYDRYGKAGVGAGGGFGFHHVDLSEALNIFMRDFGAMGGFESLFGGGRSRSDERRGQDIRATVRLTLTEVALGVKKSIKIKSPERCTACHGNGAKAGTQPTTCGACGGRGEVRRAARSMFGQFISVAPCPTCNGEGTLVLEPCEVCRGEGRVRGERSVSVDIPAGVSSNNYLTLRGLGAAGPRGGPSGDLLVMIDIKEDERFERQGDDLIYDLPLSFSQAALGGEHVVPTPYGEEDLRVPPGTQPETVLRLRGKGFPVLGKEGKGDLLVRVHVWTPERLTEEQERLFRELAKLEGEPPKRSPGFWSKLKEALGA